jgi:hypothetical protein
MGAELVLRLRYDFAHEGCGGAAGDAHMHIIAFFLVFSWENNHGIAARSATKVFI